MTKLPKFAEISENLTFLDDWEDRYRYLIELGQMVPAMSDAEKTPETKVAGCVSQVWLHITPNADTKNPTLSIRGDSDAMIVKGLVAILIALYSGRPAAEIADIDAIDTLDELGLREHLTSQRSNGLIAMVGRIRGKGEMLR